MNMVATGRWDSEGAVLEGTQISGVHLKDSGRVTVQFYFFACSRSEIA